MIYSFEHVRDPLGRRVDIYPYLATTARRARAHARGLAARGWTFHVVRWTSPGHRWYRGQRRRAARGGNRLLPWAVPCGPVFLPERWWR